MCRWSKEKRCRFGQTCKYIHYEEKEQLKKLRKDTECQEMEERIMNRLIDLIKSEIERNFWEGQDQNFYQKTANRLTKKN